MKVVTIKKEIISIQSQHLLPVNLTLLENLEETGQQVKKRIEKTYQNPLQSPWDYQKNRLPLDLSFNLSNKINTARRTNSKQFWLYLLEIAVDSIPDHLIYFIPDTCHTARRYAYEKRRLRKTDIPPPLFALLHQQT